MYDVNKMFEKYEQIYPLMWDRLCLNPQYEPEEDERRCARIDALFAEILQLLDVDKPHTDLWQLAPYRENMVKRDQLVQSEQVDGSKVVN